MRSEIFFMFSKKMRNDWAKKDPYISMNQNSQNKITESRKKAGVSLLIPERHWRAFQDLKLKENKSSADVLEYILEKHQNAGNMKLANHSKLTTQYQNEGLKLQRHSFWVDPLVWHRFKNIARFYGVSMCFLFTALFCMLENLVTNIKKYPPLFVKLYEKVKISLRVAIRRYKLDTS